MYNTGIWLESFIYIAFREIRKFDLLNHKTQ